MPDFELVKTDKGLRGYGVDADNAWKRFKAWVSRLEPGECFRFSYHRPRNVAFHRKLFALFKLTFDHWEPAAGRKRLTYKGRPIEKDFDRFRKDLTILAGFYVPQYDARGRMTLEAQSLAFDKMDDDTFEKVYEAVVKAALEHVLTNYTREDVDRVVAQIQEFGA